VRGYTLVEMLIAVIMFALITVATGFMMSGGMRGQQQIREKASDAQEARALLSTITRDLRSLFAVTGSPATYFVASGADSGPILQFTTLASRIIPDPVVDSYLGTTGSESLVPQSDNMQVTYDYDPSTHVLSRLVSRLPGVETLPEVGGPEWILSRRVGYITFTFYDADGNTRTEWNYQTPQTDTTTSQQTDTTSYDTTVPARIDVEIDLDRPNGETLVLTTTIVPANTALQPAGQKPASAQTSTGGGTGGGGTGGGGDGGGTGGGGG
jgi:prepilin-type N-terminal cleavage/methylation domain-containing protein